MGIHDVILIIVLMIPIMSGNSFSILCPYSSRGSFSANIIPISAYIAKVMSVLICPTNIGVLTRKYMCSLGLI